MNEITYLVLFKSMDKFNNIDSGHCAAVLEKGNYTEGELVDFFIESVRTNFGFKNEEIIITNIINLTKIRRELEE
jgi:hypothetical protein